MRGGVEFRLLLPRLNLAEGFLDKPGGLLAVRALETNGFDANIPSRGDDNFDGFGHGGVG